MERLLMEHKRRHNTLLCCDGSVAKDAVYVHHMRNDDGLS